MKTIATALAALVALIHIGIVIMEFFFWDHPIGRKVFDMTEAQSASTVVNALNQGLYNGFLAAGLIWGLMAKKRDVVAFFLICVVVAGIFGAITVKPTILIVQAAPAALALLVLFLSGWGADRREA